MEVEEKYTVLVIRIPNLCRHWEPSIVNESSSISIRPTDILYITTLMIQRKIQELPIMHLNQTAEGRSHTFSDFGGVKGKRDILNPAREKIL